MIPRRPPPRQQRGFILIYVVAMVAALATVVYQISQLRNSVPQQTQRQLARAIEGEEIRHLEEFVLAGLGEHQVALDPRYLAYRELEENDPARLSDLEDAVQQLRAMLSEFNFHIDGRDPKQNKNTKTAGNQPKEYRHDGNTPLFQPAAKAHKLSLGGRTYSISVRPANAIPNLNNIAYAPLWRYLGHELKIEPIAAQRLAATLIDWRDADEFTTEGIGAESSNYRPLGYPAHNAPIEHWQELAYVRGIDNESLKSIRNAFHLGPAEGPTGVLPDYLSPAALAALADLPPDTMRAILNVYGRQLDPNAPPPTATTSDAESIFGQDASRFDQAISWEADTKRLRIEIAGPNRSISIDYDRIKNRIIDRWE